MIKSIALAIVVFSSTYYLDVCGMEVTFFNVGQGNCTVITCQDHPSLLVDAGSSQHPIDAAGHDIKNKQIQAIIDYLNIKTPNKRLFVIASHGDKDHFIWLAKIALGLLDHNFSMHFLLGGSAKDYKAKLPKSESPTGKTISLQQALSFLNQKFPGRCTYSYSATIAQVTHLLPTYATLLHAQTSASDKNDTSIVLRVQYDNFSTVLPGDATGKVTNAIVNYYKTLYSTVLAASHHGSDTHGANNEAFLHTINPNCLIFSAGMHEGHHHPAENTMTRGVIHFAQKPLSALPHTVTFHRGNRTSFQSHQVLHTPTFRVPVRYYNGFATAVTTHPIYNTLNAGNITLKPQGETVYIELEKQESQDTSFKACMLKAPQISSFDAILSLSLSNLNLHESDMRTLTALPSRLNYCDLSTNNLTLPAVIHLLKLLKNHQVPLFLNLTNNQPFEVQHLIEARQEPDIQKLMELHSVDISTTPAPTNERRAFDSIALNKKSVPQVNASEALQRSGLVTQCIEENNLQEATLSISLDNKYIAAYCPSNLQHIVVLFDCQKWAIEKKVLFVIELPSSIEAVCFSPENMFLAIICKEDDTTYLWDIESSQLFGSIPGCLLCDHHNNRIMAWKPGKVGNTLNALTQDFIIVPILSPFAGNNRFIATLSEPEACIYIWDLAHIKEPLRYTISSHDIATISKKTLRDISFLSLNSLISIRVDYKDNTFVEIPLHAH